MESMLVLMIAIPIIIAIVAKVYFNHTITLFEAALQVVVIVLMVSGVWSVGRYSGAGDVELWNGEVTGKEIARQECPWGWRDYTDDFCTEYTTRRVKDGPPRQVCSTDSKGKKSCHKVQDYKTQYNYIYPWEQKFYVFTNIQETYMFPRVDRQGAITPDNFKLVYKGEPASARKSYSNWVRAASTNLFHEDGTAEEKYKDLLPAYPNEIYDFYKVDRVVTVGDVKEPAGLNDALSESLKFLGPQKQMNAVIVLVDAKVAQRDFAYALRRYWMGFKKNDAVIFLGVDSNTLRWTEVLSWSKNSMFNNVLRDNLNDFVDKPINYQTVIAELLKQGTEHYERRSMKEFEYLKTQIPVPTWLTIVLIVLSVGGSLGLTYFFHKADVDPFRANKLRRT